MIRKYIVSAAIVVCASLSACIHTAKPEGPVTENIPPPAPAGSPTEIIELFPGKNDTYFWRGRTWRSEDLQHALLVENGYTRIVEIHLLAGSTPASLQTLLEVGTMSKLLGAPAFFERDGDFKRINVQ